MALLALITCVALVACGSRSATNLPVNTPQSVAGVAAGNGGQGDSAGADTALNTIDDQLNSISNELSHADAGLNTSEGDPSQ